MGKQVFTYDITKFSAAIQKRLREAPELARAAMRAVGARVEREAKFRCPVDIGMLTASILHAAVVDQTGAAAVIYVPVTAGLILLPHQSNWNLQQVMMLRKCRNSKIAFPPRRT